MNQILIGIILSFILLSCGNEEKAQDISLEPTVITKDSISEIKQSNSSLGSSKIDSIQGDTSIYNQYKDGKKEGLWKEVDKKGRMLSEGYYKNGKANGWMKWYYKGVLTAEGNMIEDKRNGPWKICDLEDPLLCIDANFENESREGLWKIYDKNGKLYKEQTWRNNAPIAEKCWDEMGNSMTCKDVFSK